MSDDEEPLGVTMAGIEDDGAEGEIGKLVISRRNVDGRLEASVKRRSWSPSMVDPETHVPVIHIPTNELRTGDEAPKAKDLAQFMEDNPGYVVARPDLTEEEVRVVRTMFMFRTVYVAVVMICHANTEKSLRRCWCSGLQCVQRSRSLNHT